MYTTVPNSFEVPPSCGGDELLSNVRPHSPLKKVRSVDFGRVRVRSSLQTSEGASQVASLFSRRAARGSLTRGLCKDHERSCPSLCAEGERPRLRRNRSEGRTETETPTTTTTTLRIPLGAGWTLGKLSVFILLLATVVDFCVCQVHLIEAHDLYDALSAEVIRPAFRYQKSSKPARASLGSAAISTVTDVLSPILPFTGGLDLRKEDYWRSSGNWFATLQSVASQVSDAFSRQEVNATLVSTSVPRGGGNVPGKFSRRKASKHVSTISASEPFVGVDSIADLTLSDVTETFRFAVECNKEGFNEARFLNALAPTVKKVVSAMSDAMARSRGKDAKLSSAKPGGVGEVDALAFSSAMRIFAEWRLLRQVPEGYKGFAVGMSLGHKDVVQNLAKIESTAHAFLDHRRDMLALQSQWEGNGADENCPIDGTAPRELRSPTLKELLTFEVEMDLNPASRLPRLNDKTGSMGVLWVRRQLHYQTLLFDNVLKIPSKFSSTADAVTAAYKEVYDRFHGWAVQKIFNYSFQSAPDAEEIYKHMHPRKLQEATMIARKLKPAMLMSDQHNDSHRFDKADDNPFVGFCKHIGGEWDKLVSNVVGVFQKDEPELAIRGGGSGGFVDAAQQSEFDEFIKNEVIRDAHEHIQSYLTVVFPLLDDLAVLFDDMNMDDPSKV